MTTPSEPGPEGQRQPYDEPMPAAPALNEQDLAPTAAVVRPKSVDNAFLLWMIGAGISLLSVIFVFTVGSDAIKDAARESLRNAGRSFTEDDVTSLANATKVIGIVIGLIFIGLFVLFAYKMRAGRNWARITLTVLGALNIIFTLINIRSSGAINLIVSLIMAVLILVAVYFMFRPDANQYFAAGKARR
jgi:hypothetical protein